MQPVWQGRDRVDYLGVARQDELNSINSVVVNWIPGDLSRDGQRFFIDRMVVEGRLYTYAAKSKSYTGLISLTESSLIVDLPQ